MKLAPIIFIHYGLSNYLQMSLECAFRNNLNTKIVLLGDTNNKFLAKNYKFDYFSKYEKDTYIKKFNEVYKSVTSINEKHVYFTFLRWIILYNFMKDSGINRCYYFDSDTFICTDLQRYVEKLKEFDFAVINYFSGCACFVGSLGSLRKYIELMLELFQDCFYLERHKKKMNNLLKKGRKYSFCDMQVFAEYQKRINPLFELSAICNKQCFDPNISLDKSDQLCDQSTWAMKNGHKKLWWANHFPYCFNKVDNCLIKMNTLNMSWTSLLFKQEVYFKLQSGW